MEHNTEECNTLNDKINRMIQKGILKSLLKTKTAHEIKSENEKGFKSAVRLEKPLRHNTIGTPHSKLSYEE